MSFPFEAPFSEVEDNLDRYVDVLFDSLYSEFLTLPKGPGFVEYSEFEDGYEALKRITGNFRNMDADVVLDAVYQTPMVFIVLRAILGLTPSEWAYVAEQRTGVRVGQQGARSIDRRIRLEPEKRFRDAASVTANRLRALVETACALLTEGAPMQPKGVLHRLDKADTKSGLSTLQPLADLGVPYPMVLYERFLGRPFAGHRDSVSGLVGDAFEAAIEEQLSRAGVSYRKTKRAERVAGFDQTPDFIIPNEFNPKVVIEAKVTEDDGTARDKITRVQHLHALSMKDRKDDESPRFEVVACIAGRGFKERREDMKKLLRAARGKVFTLKTIEHLVPHTRIHEFKST